MRIFRASFLINISQTLIVNTWIERRIVSFQTLFILNIFPDLGILRRNPFIDYDDVSSVDDFLDLLGQILRKLIPPFSTSRSIIRFFLTLQNLLRS